MRSYDNERVSKGPGFVSGSDEIPAEIPPVTIKLCPAESAPAEGLTEAIIGKVTTVYLDPAAAIDLSSADIAPWHPVPVSAPSKVAMAFSNRRLPMKQAVPHHTHGGNSSGETGRQLGIGRGPEQVETPIALLSEDNLQLLQAENAIKLAANEPAAVCLERGMNHMRHQASQDFGPFQQLDYQLRPWLKSLARVQANAIGRNVSNFA
jgi:hypothetical protein